MSYENKISAIRLVLLVIFLVLLLIGNKYPTSSYIAWKGTIIDIYAILFLLSYYKVAKEVQQHYTMELGDLK